MANILIVEDNIIIGLDLQRAVKKLNHNVIKRVTNYEDALNIAISESIDIVLIDINLGNNKKNGIETVTDIKKIQNIITIYVTANSDENTIKRTQKTNPIGFLFKPFNDMQIKKILDLATSQLNNLT